MGLKNMNLKDNFKQAVRELWNATEEPETSREKQDGTPKEKLSVSEAVPATSAHRQPPKCAQLTTIAEGDIIEGDIHCAGRLDLFGEVTGNITGSGDLKLVGNLRGNASGNNIEICSRHMAGDITANGCVQVNTAAVITGNILAKDLVLAGKIKGNLELEDSLTMTETAAVMGNINVGRLSIANGAAVWGEIRIRDVKYDQVFSGQADLLK